MYKVLLLRRFHRKGDFLLGDIVPLGVACN